MHGSCLWKSQNDDQTLHEFKLEFNSSVFKEFGPHSNSKCFTEEKRIDYIDKLLSADISKELPKQLRGFCLGDAVNNWDQAEWRFKSKTAEKIHLWTKKTFSSSAKNLGIIRRIIVLEEFFDLIKSHHERPNKDGYNGQKKLFNLIKNRYACLPRDAVDKYITMWRKATAQVSPNNGIHPTTHEQAIEGSYQHMPKSETMRAEVTVADNNLSTTTATMPASATFYEEDRRKRNSTETSKLPVVDSMDKFSGISMVYQQQQQQQQQVTHEPNLIQSPLVNIKYQIGNGDNNFVSSFDRTHVLDSLLKQDCDSSNQGSSKENSFEDFIPNKRMKREEEDSDTNTDNEGTVDDNLSNHRSLKIDDTKRPSELDMAYNIFIRRLIDSTLDRTITFCEQPKHTILNLENVCAEAFPTLEKSRHRIKIRSYLKACRRNSKKHNGKVSMKDTPSHMCSEKAYSMANDALVKVEKELQRLKVVQLGDIVENKMTIARPVDRDGSKNDASYPEYRDLVMSSNNLESAFPIATGSLWSDSEHFSSVLANFLPSVYGMIPLPPMLTPNLLGMSRDAISPPPAHTNQYFNYLPGSLFSVVDGYSHYASTSHLLQKMLQCNSVDPDFGMELIINRSSSQEAINCMRVTARYLLSRSVMMESYLINESAMFRNISSDEKNILSGFNNL